MDVDAAQYANISREMSISNSFLQVFEQGKDYLDKPPFLFWVSALSIKFFGATNFAYKFPSICIFIFALYSLFLFVQKLYDTETALLSILILCSSQAIFLMTNDVRTDLILMSLTLISIAHIYLYTQNKKVIDFIIGFVALAFGLMSKGPICLIAVSASLGIHFLLKKDWKNIFNYKYLFGISIIVILLLPMCWGLYHQFDMHPEKTVYGIESPSGLKFFFWTQSFGRITGESSWANNMGFHFLFTNILWAFFPWSLVFIVAFIHNIYTIFKNKTTNEYISIGGFILIYIALGSSKYQLPHYIFICFPLIAIITANYLKQHSNIFSSILLLISILLALITPLFVINFVFTSNITYWYLFIFLVIVLAISIYFYQKKKELNNHKNLIVICAFFAISLNIFLTHHFYKNLLEYQASSTIGKYISKNKIDAKDIDTYKLYDGINAIHYYAQQLIISDNWAEPSKKYVITTLDGWNELKQKNKEVILIEKFQSFNITKLNKDFLFEKTRAQKLKYYYLVSLRN